MVSDRGSRKKSGVSHANGTERKRGNEGICNHHLSVFLHKFTNFDPLPVALIKVSLRCERLGIHHSLSKVASNSLEGAKALKGRILGEH